MDLRETFNTDAENYDKSRPDYPDELFDDLISYSKVGKGSYAIEIGTGTGQATKPIIETGCNVTGIELGDNLAAYVRNKFNAYYNFSVINADFMQYNAENEKYDLIFCATAFHWLPLKDALNKVMKLLKSKGTIALFWNHPFPNRSDDENNVINREVYQRHKSSTKEFAEFSESDLSIWSNHLLSAGFTNINSKIYKRIRMLTSSEYVNLLNTYSDNIAMKENKRLAFYKDITESLEKVGGKINIYDTIDLYMAQKP